MHERFLSVIAQRYFSRFGFRSQMLKDRPPDEMKVCIVIPSYDEPELLKTLDALKACVPPQFPLEVLLVFNSGAEDYEGKKKNHYGLQTALAWREENPVDWLHLHILKVEDLPPKHAGVGLARKVGMDEALRRFSTLNYTGMIVCLDADCTVAPNYLQVLERTQVNYSPESCTIYFEHLPEWVEEPALQEGIIHYELFLRYYVNALAYSNYPFAMHTIGSSMTVRADTYALSGGMNRRKAAEDFYFLHKVVQLGGFRAINDTCVFPSARVSERVPFGTGKAQMEWLRFSNKQMQSYHPHTFADLKTFMLQVPHLFQAETQQMQNMLEKWPSTLREYMLNQNLVQRVAEMKANSTTINTFYKRFFAWFDGFKVLKFVHYSRDHYYGQMELIKACNWLLEKYRLPESDDPEELLRVYRQLDKERQAVKLTYTSSV